MAVYVVWSRQLGAEEGDVASGAGLLPDPRVRHYWDPQARVGSLYMPLLLDLAGHAPKRTEGAGEAAWDVWMLFGPDATWSDESPPTPAWWEHQLAGLGLPERLRLDPDRFAARATAL